MKKLLSILLALTLILTAACSSAPAGTNGTDDTTSNEAVNPSAPEKTDEPEKPADAEPTETEARDSGESVTDSPAGTDELVINSGDWAVEPEMAGEPSIFYGDYAATDGGVFSEPSFSKKTGEYAGEGPSPMPGDYAEPGVDDIEYPDGDDYDIDVVIDDLGWEPAEPFVLTAAEWNDNENWPFFTNLVNSQLIEFPSFGVDPRHRIKVNVHAPHQSVQLLDDNGEVLWTAVSDKDGIAYLFYTDGQAPASVLYGGISNPVTVTSAPNPEDQQGDPIMTISGDMDITFPEVEATAQTGLQVMFIVDTTGSMGDELAYLQMDFASIAEDVGSDGVTWSVNFYRDEGDEYVTRTNNFTSDVDEVKAKINSEYASGGGDTPEAVKEILEETIQFNDDWDENCAKVAFLIFDAPPHYGAEESIDASIRRAAELGIRLVPVVCSGDDRETELFGRAISIVTNGTYVFLTDDSGVGLSHMEPIVGDYEVEILHEIIVRIINSYRPE